MFPVWSWQLKSIIASCLIKKAWQQPCDPLMTSHHHLDMVANGSAALGWCHAWPRFEGLINKMWCNGMWLGRLTLNMPSIKQPVVLQRATRGLVSCKDTVRTKELYFEVDVGSHMVVQWCNENSWWCTMVVRWLYICQTIVVRWGKLWWSCLSCMMVMQWSGKRRIRWLQDGQPIVRQWSHELCIMVKRWSDECQCLFDDCFRFLKAHSFYPPQHKTQLCFLRREKSRLDEYLSTCEMTQLSLVLNPPSGLLHASNCTPGLKHDSSQVCAKNKAVIVWNVQTAPALH